MKILLVGHKGFLGSCFLSRINNVSITDYKFDSPTFINFVTHGYYDIIINCAVDKKDNYTTNVKLPVFLSKSCGYLIQFSSDAVFSGNKPSNLAYNKEDLPDPVCLYGKQKVEMENALLSLSNCLVVRTSFIHPSDQFVTNILGQEQFFGFKNYYWNGLTTKQVVDLTIGCLDDNRTGLCHMFSNKSLSKYELAHEVKKIYNTTTKIVPVEHPIINRKIISDFNTELDLKTLTQK